ncbi:ribonuclease domain-containing protein [Propionispira raffinosivorans]|uniref:ribonuclease domain-containing protein n=1 Tax=Propionispira raffinosivorans TaxID=86959 RepID=UPI00037A874A|nr:ribonuclease domain-containing protein [Propionispira raffinosivorans]
MKKAVANAANNKDKDPVVYQEALHQISLWKAGGENKILLDSVVGGMMSSLGGGSFGSGAVSSGLNQAFQGELSKITDPAAHQWASFIIGSAASKLLGGDALTGGSITSSETKNNDLDHDQQIQFAADLTLAIFGDEKTNEEVKANIKDVIQNWININSQTDPDLKATDEPTMLLIESAADTLGIKFSYNENDSLTNNLNTIQNKIDLEDVMQESFAEFLRPRVEYELSQKGIYLSNTNYAEEYKKEFYTERENQKIGLMGSAAEVGSITGVNKIAQGLGKTIGNGRVESLPQNVQDMYKKYNNGGWQGNVAGQTAGTKAGKTYQNNDGTLPTTDTAGNSITYKEFDVNNKLPNSSRDGERFVVGSDGSVYYTNSHYGDIQSPNGLPSFLKIE